MLLLLAVLALELLLLERRDSDGAEDYAIVRDLLNHSEKRAVTVEQLVFNISGNSKLKQSWQGQCSPRCNRTRGLQTNIPLPS